MSHIYYEPISDQIYICKWDIGSKTRYLHKATNGKHLCPWHLENSETFFYYMGKLNYEI